MTWTGNRLRDARARRGWTQEEAAKQIGAAPRSWASWEREEAKPQAHWAIKLDELFGGTEQDGGAAELDQNTIDRALDEASFVDLLAAIARRHTRDTRRGGESSDLPAGGYVWRTEDAPSSRQPQRRGSGHNAQTTDGQAL